MQMHRITITCTLFFHQIEYLVPLKRLVVYSLLHLLLCQQQLNRHTLDGFGGALRNEDQLCF